jgi:sec-independent protein translocase protein TatB
MFGINGGELIVLLIVAVVVVGPERLPGYAEQLARWARQLRLVIADAKERITEELGPELGAVDWESLDPRRYDPRRIVRDALTEEIQQVRSATAGLVHPGDGPAPFDDEAT